MVYTIGIDIGGTTTSYGIISSEGEIVAKGKIPTRGTSFDDYFAELSRRLREMTKDNGLEGKIRGIGIGAPCANHTTGSIEGATDLPWPSPIPLKELFEKDFGLPVAVDNDANASTIGEMEYGAARGMKNFIVLTLGTGVGAGIVVDGRLLYGSRGFAGELGHVTVAEGGHRSCSCGRCDCLQMYCNARGVVETALQLLRDDDSISLLREKTPAELTPKFIFECAEKGDRLSLKTFELTGNAIGRACANFAAFTDPDAIIFFGGVAQAFHLMLPAIRKAMEENILFLYKDRIKILKSGLTESDAALLGASALAINALESI